MLARVALGLAVVAVLIGAFMPGEGAGDVGAEALVEGEGLEEVGAGNGGNGGGSSQLAVDLEASFVLVDLPRNIRSVVECPTPWAWYHPDDRPAVADGTIIDYHDDRSGNNRFLTPHDTSAVRVRTAGGQRLLYHDVSFVGATSQLSTKFDGGGPIDWDGTPPNFGPLEAFTFLAVVVGSEVASDLWFSMYLQGGSDSAFQAGTASSFADGVLYAFDAAFSNLFGPPLSTGVHVVMARYDVNRGEDGEAELLLDGELVDSKTGLGSGGNAAGFQVLGLRESSTGGLGELILWDEWLEDDCIPDLALPSL